MVQVSLSTSTTFDGDLNALIEDQGTALTVRFDLDEPAPEGGLTLFVDSDVEQMLNRLDLPGFAFNPTTENVAFESVVTNRDSSGFVLTIDEGETFGTVTLSIFNNQEPEPSLPETFDGLVEATFSLLTESQVNREIEGPIPELSDYSVDAAAATSVVLFADEVSQLPGDSPPPPAAGPIQVSLFTGPDYLIEDEGTLSAHTFLANNGVIPEEGLVVSVDAPNLSEFDLDSVSVEGGEIVAVREDGFDLRMTEYTTLVNLSIAPNTETEVGETANFSLAAGEGYEIVESYSSGTFNLVDTRSDIPRGIVTEPNDIVGAATKTGITAETPSFAATDSIYFDIGNRYLNADGSYTYIDYNEDVDLYQVELNAGDTIAVETFEISSSNRQFGLLTGLSLLDAEGDRLSATGLSAPAAPDKLFGSFGAYNPDGTVNENETDGYLEVTVPEDGTYYVGVSSYISAGLNFFGENYAFDIETPGAGEDSGIVLGSYGIEIELLTEENPRKTGTPTPPVSNPNVTTPPMLSLSANPSTVDSSGNFTSGVVEFVELGGVSSVNFTIRAEGEIPEEGIEFVLNSDANLFDYVSFLGQTNLPSTIGGQSLGAYYNEEGIPTGIRLLIQEPTMTVSYESANRNPGQANFFGAEPLLDQFEPLETDGEETVTFSLLAGEGYEVATDAGTTEVTYYDSIEDVPVAVGEGSTVPEVSISASETTLIESEGTETTLTFTLSEPPPAEGITVFIDSEDDPVIGSPLSQFDVLEAEISGGDFPVPNSDSSGFFFNITEQTATITLSVFDELSVIDDPLTVQEGILALNFALQPLDGYSISSVASDVTLNILDNPASQIQVSLAASTEGDPASTTLVESEGTVSIQTFSLSAPPPAEGLTVRVSASSLDNFDLAAIALTGSTVSNIGENGFDLTITERTATVALPIIDDGAAEDGEIATFTLESGEGYEINQAATEATFSVVDTPDQVAGVAAEIERNNTLSEANALALSAQNPSVSISGALFSYAPTFPGLAFGYSEDVDFYSVTLAAGQTLSVDIDGDTAIAQNLSTIALSLEDILQKTDSELRLFDAAGNELAANNDGAAPGEDFSRDPYLEFTADTAGTYYIGVSQLGNRNYDPNVEASGSGWIFPEVGVFFGDYELTATLIDDSDVQPPSGTLTSTPGDDILTGNDNDETVAGDLGDDVITGGAGDDILRGDLNDRSPQDDVAGGNDIIFGGEGNDSIGGKAGNDILIGDAGDDMIWGDAGDDILMGVTGNDILVGDNFSNGSGSDLFVFGNDDGTDTILDFEVGIDRIGLVDGELMFEDLTLTQDGANTLLGVAESGEVLAVLNNVQSSTLDSTSFEIVPDVSNPEEALALI
ncbi:MAG: pre-peptidase C-terminal domain-containing protein [Cyanobacteria bacterium J06623_4]